MQVAHSQWQASITLPFTGSLHSSHLHTFFAQDLPRVSSVDFWLESTHFHSWTSWSHTWILFPFFFSFFLLLTKWACVCVCWVDAPWKARPKTHETGLNWTPLLHMETSLFWQLQSQVLSTPHHHVNQTRFDRDGHIAMDEALRPWWTPLTLSTARTASATQSKRPPQFPANAIARKDTKPIMMSCHDTKMVLQFRNARELSLACSICARVARESSARASSARSCALVQDSDFFDYGLWGHKI